ncbi:MAG: hypothetical protein M3Y08_18590 [Fibrobacterota bacterium]|nr:hypothetical protein [Fibrobacterota bacterium]
MKSSNGLFRNRRWVFVFALSGGLVLGLAGCNKKEAEPQRERNAEGYEYDTLITRPKPTGSKEDLVRLTLVQQRQVVERPTRLNKETQDFVVTVLSDGTEEKVLGPARGASPWITRDGKYLIYRADGLSGEGVADGLGHQTIWLEDVATKERKRLVTDKDPSPDYTTDGNFRIKLGGETPTNHRYLSDFYYHAPSDQVFINDPPWFWVYDLATGKKRKRISYGKKLLPTSKDRVIAVGRDHSNLVEKETWAKVLDVNSSFEKVIFKDSTSEKELYIEGMRITDKGDKIQLLKRVRTITGSPDTLWLLGQDFSIKETLTFDQSRIGKIDPSGNWFYFSNYDFVGRVRLETMIAYGKPIPEGWLEQNCEIIFGFGGFGKVTWSISSLNLTSL